MARVYSDAYCSTGGMVMRDGSAGSLKENKRRILTHLRQMYYPILIEW